MQLRCPALRGAAPHSHAACPSTRVHRVLATQRLNGNTIRCRTSSYELDNSITSEDVAKFEKIAASLVAKYGVEDVETDDTLEDTAGRIL
jgi:hypothetical protein